MGTQPLTRKSRSQGFGQGALQLYAERQRVPGHAFSPDSEWQRQFEENFGYTETDDQLRSINEIKADMEKPCPWTGSSAVMWATEKPRSPCGPS